MIALAQSRRLTAHIHASSMMRRLAAQFIGGRDAAQAIARAQELRRRGIDSSLFFLGEYVDQPELIEGSVTELLGVMPRLAEAGLDVHVSVDPTQVGAMISWSLCAANVCRIADALDRLAAPRRKVLMLDMEDSSVTQATLDLYASLRSRSVPAAITIQAYLRRSDADIRCLASAGATVRLVKGALAERSDVAFTARADIDASYRALSEHLLSPDAKAKGVRPVFGTHDERMIAHADRLAVANGWTRDQWEIEMLLGVRPSLQRDLVARGFSLRLYVPFGESWWPYSIRRVGETPKNLFFVVRALLAR